MGVIVIDGIDNVGLSSYYSYDAANSRYIYRATTDKATRAISVTGIPSGARVTRAVLEVTVSGMGASGNNMQQCTAYGVDVRSDNGAEQTNIIRLDIRTNRIVNVEFIYQTRNGGMDGVHGFGVWFRNITIRVEYLEGSETTYTENAVLPPAKGIWIYKPHENNFDKNGIALHPLSCEVSEEDAGEYTLAMTHPYDPDGVWKLLQEEWIIDAPVPPHKIPAVTMPVKPLWRVKTSVEQTPLYTRLPTYTKAKTPVDDAANNPSSYAWSSTRSYTDGNIVTYDGYVYVANMASTGRQPGSGAEWSAIRPVNVTPSQQGTGQGTYNPGVIAEYITGGTTVAFVANYDSNYLRIRSPLGVTGYASKKDLEQTGTDADPITVPERTIYRQRFRIKSVTCDEIQKQISVSAEHISYDFQRNALFDCQVTEEDAATAIAVLQGSLMDDDTRLIVCPIEHPLITADWSFMNPMQALLDPDEGLTAQLQAQVLRDNDDIFILPNEIMRKGPRLAYGTNLTGVSWTRSTEDLVTRVIPRADDGNDGYLYLDELWIDSDHINEYAVKYIEILDSEYAVGQKIKKADGTEKTLSRSEVLERMRTEAEDRYFVDNADQPAITLEVDFVLLGDTEEYRQLRNLQRLCLYDQVEIDTGSTTVTAQVTGYTWDSLAGRYSGITIGKVFSQARRKMPGYRMANATITYAKLSPGLMQKIKQMAGG